MQIDHLYKFITGIRLDVITRYLLRYKLRIVMFHGIIDDDIDFDCYWLLKKAKFLKQINYLYNNFNLISIDDALFGNSIPENSCVLTFDDGYKSMLTHVYPILKHRNIPFTVYVSSGPVAKRTLLWTDKVFIYLYNMNDRDLDSVMLKFGKYSIDCNINKKIFRVALLNNLKKMDYRKKNALIEKLVNGGAIWLNYFGTSKNPFEMLTVEDVKQLADDPLVTIGAHTVNHEVLTSMPFEEAVSEIKESKDALEGWTGKPIIHFSYPDGKYDQALANKVRELGFRSATRIGLKINWHNKPFELCRVGTNPEDDEVVFKSMVNGIISLKAEVKDFLRELITY